MSTQTLDRPMSRKLPAGMPVIASLFGFLPAFTNVKVADLQPVDVILLLLLLYCVTKFAFGGFAFRAVPAMRSRVLSYLALTLTLMALALLALRMPFFPLDNASVLKQPLLLSISKLAQFTAVLCGYLWLANVFLKDRVLVERALGAYWLAGVLCSWYSLASLALIPLLHIDPTQTILGAYQYTGAIRVRGFFFEGGPYGVFQISVFLAGLMRRRLLGKKMGLISSAVVLLAFVLSASKAGFLAVILLLLYWAVSAASFRQKVLYFPALGVLVVATAVGLDLPSQLQGYFFSYQTIEEQAALRSSDYNLILGRIAAMYIVPRMIAAHPITGIGFGNYPLMRNNPQFLGALPAVTDAEDLPGLGIPGDMAQMGVPARLWLLGLQLMTWWLTRKKGALISAAALFLPLASLLGVQLTFFYPWFIDCCVLALAAYTPAQAEAVERTALRRPLLQQRTT